jgi:hypothetical protein
MAISSLVKKLHIKQGQRILLLNGPVGYSKTLGQLPEGVELAQKPKGTFDFVQLFVKNSDELNHLAPQAIKAVKHDGLLWICYPKRSSKVQTDLTRDVIWDLVKDEGLIGVSLVSIDDVWSAMRFRPPEKVKK